MNTPYTTTEHGDLVPQAEISPDGSYPYGITVYPFATIEHGCVFGHNCVVGSNVFVGANSMIGDGTRIQHGAFIARGSRIGRNVFIGPLAILTDDKYPRVQTNADGSHESCYKAEPPILEDGCSIGAGAIILPGVRIGAGAMVGAGAVVTKDVPANGVATGVPSVVGKLKYNVDTWYHD